MKIIDKTGHYGNTKALLKSAERKIGLKFKGGTIIYLDQSGNAKDITDLKKRMKGSSEVDGTIAWTAYSKTNRTAYISSVIKKSPRWAIEHELAHAVLMSNGIYGHPAKYAKLFKYW